MAKTRRHEKNLAKVQSMIDGTYDSEFGKIQVGQYDPAEKTRKVGDKWKDSDGVEWEQREGYRVKGRSTGRHYSWDMNCKDCGTNCGSTKGELNRLNNKTYIRMNRCYYCQIDFEAILKTRKIGERNNKHFFWVKLMTIQRWEQMEKEANERMIQIFDTNTSNKHLDNALANANIKDAQEAAK
tara:strand:+ start:705 stop:1253 length:549 start_codon:yes stop_codon:yes gene_type:complete